MSVKESQITKDQFRGDILQRDYSARYDPSTKTYTFDYVVLTPKVEEALNDVTYLRFTSDKIADVEQAISDYIKKMGAPDTNTGSVNSNNTGSVNSNNTGSVNSNNTDSNTDSNTTSNTTSNTGSVNSNNTGSTNETLVFNEPEVEEEYKTLYNEASKMIDRINKKPALTEENEKQKADARKTYNAYETYTNPNATPEEKVKAKAILNIAATPSTAGLYGNMNEGLNYSKNANNNANARALFEGGNRKQRTRKLKKVSKKKTRKH